MIEFTAWATTNGDMGAGISISEREWCDGTYDEHGFVDEQAEPVDWPEWDQDRADAMLSAMGWARISQWVESGGQMAATVERVSP